jgi:hypothetical protein
VNLHSFFMLANSACGTKTGIFPSLYDGMTCANGGVQITSADQIWKLVGNLTRIVMFSAGSLAVIFIIVGGIWYVTSMGDPSRLKRAKEIINASVVGLLIAGLAYTAVTVIANGF